MLQSVRTIFLFLFCAMLVYGGWLYWDIFLEIGFSKQMKWVSHAPSGISNVYEQEFTRTLSDQRHPLVTGLAALKGDVLEVSFTRKVEKGRDGWIFLKDEVPGRNELLQSLGIRPYPRFELKMWQLIIAQRAAWTKAQGMEYVLLIVPNKTSIYPEYLSSQYHPVAARSTRLLTASLPGITVIDLADSLLHKKNIGQLFHKNDTHWNELGAFIAYQSLMKALPPPFRETPLPLDSARVEWVTEPPGDLARMLLLNHVLTERAPHVAVRNPQAKCTIECGDSFGPWMAPKHFENPRARLPKVFFDHDSFLKAMMPFVAEHFQETIFYWEWQGFNEDAIVRTQPALVVDEFVERSLIGDRPRNNPPILQHYWQQHFGNLPQLVRLPCKNLRQAFRQIEILPEKEAMLLVVALELTPEAATRLVVEYDDKVVHYPLEAGKKNTVYLEWERPRIKDLRVEGDADVAIELRVGAY